MTVESRAQRALYQGNGAASEFPFDFAVYGPEQVKVITADASGRETERIYGSEFSVRLGVAGTGGYAGGTVCYPLTGRPLERGEKIAVLSAVPSTQDKSFPNNTPYFQEQIEGGFDKLTRLVQQLEDDVARSLKVPPTSSETPEEMGADLLSARDAAEGAAARAEAARAWAGAERERAGEEADRAAREADRAAGAATLGVGAENLEAVWRLDADAAAGDALNFPDGVVYFPGRNMLRLSCDGVELYRGPQYEEMGEKDKASSSVRMLIPLTAGAVMRAWSVASNVARNVEAAEAAARTEADRAKAEADRAAGAVTEASASAVARAGEEADRAETARTVAQNAAMEATEQADRADEAALDAKRHEAGAKRYEEEAGKSRDEARAAARCAEASARGRSLASVRDAALLDRVPSGFFLVDPLLVVPATVQHPLTPVEGPDDLPDMDGFFLFAPLFPDCLDPDPEEPGTPGDSGGGWAFPCGKRIG